MTDKPVNMRRVVQFLRLRDSLTPQEQATVDFIGGLSDAEAQVLMDWLRPQPQKKSGKKAAGEGGKSKHASSLQQQIQGTATGKPHLGEGPVCGICAHTEDYEDHFKPSPHYHEFQPPATTAASGGGG